MAAPFGNNYTVKLRTDELKIEAYRQYCEHLSKGKSKRSFVFKHPELTLTWETMEKYLKYDKVFDPIHMEVAMAESFAHWEEIVSASAVGKNKDANTASLQMVMRNKFGWDARERAHEQAANALETLLSSLKTTKDLVDDSGR